MQVLDLGALLARAGAAQPPQRPEGSIPLPEAAAATLLERLAELNHNPVPLKEGMLVTCKAGWEFRVPAYATQPMLVVDLNTAGYAIPAAKESAVHVHRFDVVLLDLHSDGSGCLRLHDSRMLEPWPRAAAPAAESGEA